MMIRKKNLDGDFITFPDYLKFFVSIMNLLEKKTWLFPVNCMYQSALFL